MAKTKQQVVDSWVQGMQNPTAVQNWIAGINSVTESPMAKAAAQVPKAVQNYQAAMNSPAYREAMDAVSISDWKKSAVDMSSRFGQGATKGKKKYTTFVERFLPVWAEMKSKAQAIPGTGFAAAAARSNAALQVLMNAGRKAS